jgi:hypothetical protein
MAVDQLDRALAAKRAPSHDGRFGGSLRWVGRRASMGARRLVVFAFALVQMALEAILGAVGSVLRAATELVSRVFDLGALVLSRIAGLLRRVAA